MRVTVLASGSAGNSILIEADRTRVLVDAGLSAREIAKRIERSTLATRLDDVQAVCVTHEHTDHVGGVASLASAGMSVFATAGTARAARLKGARTVQAGMKAELGDLHFLPITLPHDASEPVGYVFSDGNSRLGVLTDCGYASSDVAAAFSGCDILILETNHDLVMLRNGSYPPALKRRVGGDRGHLSNDQAGDVLRMMGKSLPRVLVLAHLSQKNNRPRLARQAIDRVLPQLGPRPRVLIAAQDRPIGPITCEAGNVCISSLPESRQLSLAFPD